MFRQSRTAALVCLFLLIAGLGQIFAQGGSCRDPWINSAFNQIYHRAPQGSGISGECNINLYGGGRWSNYQDLYNKVMGSKYCPDPWIGEAYAVAFRRRPAGNECSPVNYGGGHWSNFDDLVAKVQQFQSQQASTRSTPPAPPANAWHPSQPVYNQPSAPPSQPRSFTLVSALGAKCLDAEGGRSGRGVHMIGYPCSGNSNEQFQFHTNGTITQNGFCLDDNGGLGRPGDQVQLWDCNGGPNQRWRLVNGQLMGVNNLCVDLKGGQSWWFGNQPAILWNCNGQINQHWFPGVVVRNAQVRGATVVRAGALTPLHPVSGSVIPAGAGNVITAGGGNVIAAGGGNVIAAGGGNVIAAGGGNVIAAGGGNVIAAGGGNMIMVGAGLESNSGGGDEEGVQGITYSGH